MSFFDDDEPFDEPTRVTRPSSEQPRRPAGPVGGGAPDPDTARRRQIILAAVGVLVLILLVLAMRGCVSSSRDEALTGYAADVSELLTSSQADVGRPLFETLSSGGQANEVQVALNRLRSRADGHARRAEELSPPGGDRGASAQHALELAMNLRASAVRTIADQVPAALGQGQTSRTAVSRIAGQVGALYASDVLVASRTKPLTDEALRDAEIGGSDVEAPRLVRDVGWLSAREVGSRLGVGGRERDAADRPASPGTHGHGIQGVSIGGTTLSPGAPAEVPAGDTVTVKVQNQGENDERNVPVTVSIGEGIRARSVLRATSKGEEATATVRLPEAPPTGRQLPMTVAVAGVPGEESTENNRQRFQVTFTEDQGGEQDTATEGQDATGQGGQDPGTEGAATGTG